MDSILKVIEYETKPQEDQLVREIKVGKQLI
jgi:hypothetical protein